MNSILSNSQEYWWNTLISFGLALTILSWVTGTSFMLFLQRNYRFFYMFISTSTILCVYVFVFSWINILHQKGSMRKAMSHDILSDVLIVYCFIAVWFVGGLTVFHFYLICTNQVSFLLKFLRNFINWKYIDYFFLFATDCDI